MVDIIPEDNLIPKRSRWVIGSGVERYDKKTLDTLGKMYTEADGWSKAARVKRHGR